MRRVDGNQVSKSRYSQKKKEEEAEEEEIDFAQEEIYEEAEKPDCPVNKDNTHIKIIEENVTKENNHFENLKIDENIISNFIVNEEGKNEAEIKINQNELINAMKELEDNSNSGRDDSQVSVNEGIVILTLQIS